MSLGPELRFLDRTKVLFEGRSCVFFGGNDYHRLASHPEVLRAAQELAGSDGLSAAGSRATTGNHPVYGQLEQAAAAFLGAEEAVLCSDGYLSNTVALEAVAGGFQRFFLDEGAHASLKTPAEALPAGRLHRFPASDPDGLGKALKAHLGPGERPLVLTDGVVSGSGELRPLLSYWDAVRTAGGMLLVDDAHGMGTIGPTGKGSPEEAGLPPEACLQTGTFAKAFGAFGGVLAGPRGLAAKVHAHSRAFTGATPVPPPLAAAALRAVGILRERPELIAILQTRTRHCRERLRALGLPSCDSPAPILSVTHGDEIRNLRLRVLLLEAGIYPTFINYPGCPPGGHFRFTLSSVHTDEEIESLLGAIAQSCA